jgi:hypothetical protein
MDQISQIGFGLSLMPLAIIAVVGAIIGYFVVRGKIQKPQVDSPSQNALRLFRRAFLVWIIPMTVVGGAVLLTLVSAPFTMGMSLMALVILAPVALVALPASFVVSIIFIVMGFVERSRGVAAATEVAAAEVAATTEVGSEANTESSKEENE